VFGPITDTSMGRKMCMKFQKTIGLTVLLEGWVYFKWITIIDYNKKNCILILFFLIS